MASIENQSYGLNSHLESNQTFPLQFHTPDQFDSYENLTSDLNSNLNEIQYQRKIEEPDPSYFNSTQPAKNNQSQLLNLPLFLNNKNNNNNNFPDSYNNNSYITQDNPTFDPYHEPNSGTQYATNNINNSYPVPDLTGYATYQIPNPIADKLINESSNYSNNLASTPIQINQPNFINYSANFQTNPIQQPTQVPPQLQPAAQPQCHHIKAGIPFIAQETCFNNKFCNKMNPIAFASIPHANNFSFNLNNSYGLNISGFNNFSNLFNKLAMNHHHHHHHHHHSNFAFNNSFNTIAGLKRLGNFQMLNANFNTYGNTFGLRNGFGLNTGYNKILNSSLNTFGQRLIY